MDRIHEFDNIRPYTDEEVPQIVEQLVNDEAFKNAASHILGGIPFEMVAAIMRSCKTVRELQEKISYKAVLNAVKNCTDDITLDISSVKEKDKAYIYISNHRDIVLDSSLLAIKLFEQGLDTVEIGIGDNLLIYPWIRNFVRINKAFIVKRGLAMRQQLEASTELSRYIHFAITEKKQSIWIAQREGRAKDSSDITQESVLKMMAMGGSKDVKESLKELNLMPLNISYEYDPCDYLKAKEMQLKRDNADYKKSQSDDLENMGTGITGYKGRITFKTAECINGFIDSLPQDMSKPELFKAIAEHITKEIHRNYTLYPCNYIAFDMLNNTEECSGMYTAEQKSAFKKYLEGQIAKINIPNKDEEFLKERILTMYMNPVKNYKNAQ